AGPPCPNGTVCDGAETCNSSGICVAGTPPAIDDGNACTADGCDPVNGVFHSPVAAGTPCPNGTVCHGAEACNSSGMCIADMQTLVHDGNPWTADGCDPVNGVFHNPVAAGTACP